MARRRTLAAPPPDPFGERRPVRWTDHRQLLGGEFAFETDSACLRRIVHSAYGQLPPQRFAGRAPRFRIRLLRNAARRAVRRAAPGVVRPMAAHGILGGAVDGASVVTLTPQQRSGLILVAGDLLRHAYHVRYELLEFAVYVLAARAQRLLPLHAACLGHRGAGVLLIGASGAGKSTLVLQALLDGLELLAEDSVLVRPQGLLATGVPSYVHVRLDGLRFLQRAERARLRRGTARIRRRSGVAKLEIDVRRRALPLASAPLPIRAVVFLSRQQARGESLLRSLPAARLLTRLAAAQRYAAQQPGWQAFCARIARLPGYELRRGSHPQRAVEALRTLLEPWGRRGTRSG
jgi:energy-coupling factor transporter ATP-binding protein EcfA2